MRCRLLWFLICLSILSAGGGCYHLTYSKADGISQIDINRFDSALYRWIETDDSLYLKQVYNRYPQMLDVLGKALFKSSIIDTIAYLTNLINYFSEPALKSLYKDALGYFSDDSSVIRFVREELTFDFENMLKFFPDVKIPAVYIHVSGFQQNIIVADSLLSFSADKYLGEDYPLYLQFFYNYQRSSMKPERIAKDCLIAWLKSEYPEDAEKRTLLDKMIYEGKFIYALTKINERYDYQNIMSMSEIEIKWLKKFEKTLLLTMIERNHLYMPDNEITDKYFMRSPSTFISDDAPSGVGYYVGYKIVEQYAVKTRCTLQELLRNNDTSDIFKKSKYKP